MGDSPGHGCDESALEEAGRIGVVARDCGQDGVCASRAPGCQYHLLERARELVAERDAAYQRGVDDARRAITAWLAAMPLCDRGGDVYGPYADACEMLAPLVADVPVKAAINSSDKKDKPQ